MSILSGLFARLFGGKAQEETAPRDDFEALNRHAPLRDKAESGSAAQAAAQSTFLCREAVLDRQQRIAGYQFMLHEGTRNRVRLASRRVRHVYAEVLVRTIVRFGIAKLLGHRRAILGIPDSFLDHPSIGDLAPANTVLVVEALQDDGAPSPEALRETVRRLRGAGFRIAIPDPDVVTELACLLPDVDHIMVHAAVSDAVRTRDLARRLPGIAPRATLIARELPSQEDFQLCYKLGAALFQGPFVTRREDWHDRQLGPSTARLADLINRLRQDAPSHELAEGLKQDAALSLRLMRYINSAAVGLQEQVSSIERALMLLGRDKLYRWLMLLLYSAEPGSPRAPVALENALIRARLLELLGEGRPPRERDTLFLVGLLSLVDLVLEVPLEQAMESLGVAAEIEEAVIHGRGPHADLLQLAIACEGMNPGCIDETAARCGVSPVVASTRHLEALAWALDLEP